MSTHTIVSRFYRAAVAGGLAFIFPLAAVAVDTAPAQTLTVSVFSDGYIAAGRQFSDLDALERWVKPTSPRVLRLDGCGPASATQLLATVERFQHAYLEIRMLGVGEPGCVAGVAGRPIRAAYAVTHVLAGERDDAVDRYWRSVMP
jgi:hypothetical protein